MEPVYKTPPKPGKLRLLARRLLRRYHDRHQPRPLAPDQPTPEPFTCKRCGYSWYPRNPRPPLRCPNPKCQARGWMFTAQPKFPYPTPEKRPTH